MSHLVSLISISEHYFIKWHYFSAFNPKFKIKSNE